MINRDSFTSEMQTKFSTCRYKKLPHDMKKSLGDLTRWFYEIYDKPADEVKKQELLQDIMEMLKISMGTCKKKDKIGDFRLVMTFFLEKRAKWEI